MSKKYLESPILHRQHTARRTVDLADSLITELEERKKSENPEPQPKKKAARKLF